MKSKMVVVVDIDGTLASPKSNNQTYSELDVIEPVRTRLVQLKEMGFWIILATSRNMRTYEGNIGRIMKNTAPILVEWLEKHNIPYDELHFGKPWCGDDGFYIDDRAIRPREFATLSLEEIATLIEKDKFLP